MFRRAVALVGRKELDREHLAFLAGRTGGDIDTTDPEQLLLPGLRFVLFFCDDITTLQEFSAERYVAFSVSV